MKIAVLVFPGSNRERDAAKAIDLALGIKVIFVWHEETALPKGLDAIFLPGGFSWGDYLRAGAMASRAPIMPAVVEAAKKGMFLYGICNGFQILLEAGLLPGALVYNQGLKFISRAVPLKIENNQTGFTKFFKKDQPVLLPIAHMQGNYQAPPDQIEQIEQEGRVFLRYCNDAAEQPAGNGSAHDIAGISDATGRIIGLMPHPENAIHDFHCSRDGVGFFKSLCLN